VTTPSAGTWDAVIGQQPAKEYLRSVLRSGRQAHAFLFKGSVGVGKRSLAYVFAQVVLCTHRPEPDIACGVCKSCRWFQGRQGEVIDHPDVIRLMKFSGSPDSMGRREEKPVGDHEPLIRLETIQNVCEQLHRSPMAGERRAVIIPEAQRLCRGQAEPANAFLKTLEEPPKSSLIILTTSQPEALLETIISRVQGVQLRRLNVEEIGGALALRAPKQSDEQRKAAAQMSDGSLGRALELLEGDLKTWRQAVLAGLERFNAKSCPGFGLGLWAVAETEGERLFNAEKEAEKNAESDETEDESGEGEGASEAEQKTEAGWKRFVFRRMLELNEICFRDALIAASGPLDEAQSARLLLQPDQHKLAAQLAGKFGAEGCMKVLANLREALLALRLYVRGDVIGRALSGKLVEAMRAGK
jgi:DNA polymerase III delta prime subunit